MWLPSGKHLHSHHRLFRLVRQERPSRLRPAALGILAFEAAKTMAHLIALHRSISDQEFRKLCTGTITSPGVTFLNSADGRFLLTIACAEKLHDLDKAATAVFRLTQKCSDDNHLKNFKILYENVRQGLVDFTKIQLDPKKIEELLTKTGKHVNSTAHLHQSLEALRKLELQKKTLKSSQWNKNEKLRFKRRQAEYYKIVSLWSHKIDHSVELLAQIIFIVFVRICVVFGRFVPSLPRVPNHSLLPTGRHFRSRRSFLEDINKHVNMTQKSRAENEGKSKKLGPQATTANTVGAAGLTTRYANIIKLTEKCLKDRERPSEETRRQMWEMLPERLRQILRAKLKSRWRSKGTDSATARYWRQESEKIMAWLGPVAHDTLRWQQDRNLEAHRFDVQPTVLLLQTLHYSDLKKTEAAIVEILVGLSCMFRTKKQVSNYH